MRNICPHWAVHKLRNKEINILGTPFSSPQRKERRHAMLFGIGIGAIRNYEQSHACIWQILQTTKFNTIPNPCCKASYCSNILCLQVKDLCNVVV